MSTTLDDQITTSILNAAAPSTGGYWPVSPLASLRGKPLTSDRAGLEGGGAC